MDGMGSATRFSTHRVVVAARLPLRLVIPVLAAGVLLAVGTDQLVERQHLGSWVSDFIFALSGFVFVAASSLHNFVYLRRRPSHSTG